ncbi:MAG: hypothetical protein V4590_08875 [Bacteroidota bacterium]
MKTYHSETGNDQKGNPNTLLFILRSGVMVGLLVCGFFPANNSMATANEAVPNTLYITAAPSVLPQPAEPACIHIYNTSSSKATPRHSPSF